MKASECDVYTYFWNMHVTDLSNVRDDEKEKPCKK